MVTDRHRKYESHKPEGMSVSEWKRLMDQRKAEFEKRMSTVSDDEFAKLIRPSSQDDRVLR